MQKRETTRIAGYEFSNEDAYLDFQRFENCSFTDCKIIIHGSGPFDLENNNFVRCKFVFSGPAANTLQILTKLYQGGFRELVDVTLQNIRNNKSPKID
jgi:hypothetical protein